ncbi:MAG: hypothetical protein JNL80_09765 [Phycisphaerae bacterium]|nr:hypothetical protein [Phycisphaerae bacterium]
MHLLQRFGWWLASARRGCVRIAFLTIVVALAPGCSTGGISIARESRAVTADDGFPLVTHRLFEWKGSDPATEAATREAAGLLVYVQGSDDRTVLSVTEHLAGACAMGLDVVAVERRGVTPEGNVQAEVARQFCTKDRRVRDERTLIDSYLNAHPSVIARAQPVILMGASEGADVAAAVAASEPRVTHLILIAGGGGWTQAEEFRHMLAEGRIAIPEVSSVAGLDQKFEDIRLHPDAEIEWFGHPYRRWSSYLFERASDHLITLDIPILVIHGDADTAVPVESARALRDRFLAAGKTNLQYVEYEGVDHTLHGTTTGASVRPWVEIDTIEWLAARGALSAEYARMFVDRVRRAHPDLPARRGGDSEKRPRSH